MQNKERDILASLLFHFLFYSYTASQLANAPLIDFTSSSGLLYLTFA